MVVTVGCDEKLVLDRKIHHMRSVNPRLKKIAKRCSSLSGLGGAKAVEFL
jgi:hypothetical protein